MYAVVISGEIDSCPNPLILSHIFKHDHASSCIKSSCKSQTSHKIIISSKLHFCFSSPVLLIFLSKPNLRTFSLFPVSHHLKVKQKPNLRVILPGLQYLFISLMLRHSLSYCIYSDNKNVSKRLKILNNKRICLCSLLLYRLYGWVLHDMQIRKTLRNVQRDLVCTCNLLLHKYIKYICIS